MAVSIVDEMGLIARKLPELIPGVGESMSAALEIRILWSDYDVVELRVRAQNARFCASTDVYIGKGVLAEAASLLTGFPLNSADSREVTLGAFGFGFAGGAAKLEFFTKDLAGHTVLRATIEADEKDNQTLVHLREERPESAVLYIDFEPAALDEFIEKLQSIESSMEGSATLHGLSV